MPYLMSGGVRAALTSSSPPLARGGLAHRPGLEDEVKEHVQRVSTDKADVLMEEGAGCRRAVGGICCWEHGFCCSAIRDGFQGLFHLFLCV